VGQGRRQQTASISHLFIVVLSSPRRQTTVLQTSNSW